jgi:phosphoribosylamine--glycine ligase
VLHAGTARDSGGRLVAAGGRVLGVTAAAATVHEAVACAQAAIKRISFADGFWRADIGWREIARENAAKGKE